MAAHTALGLPAFVFSAFFAAIWQGLSARSGLFLELQVNVGRNHAFARIEALLFPKRVYSRQGMIGTVEMLLSGEPSINLRLMAT